MSQATAKKTSLLSIQTITKIGILAALAGVLMLFEAPLWFAPSFYKLDLSEIPVLIGALTLGPVAGVTIELIKILLNFVLNGTITGGVGELGNFIIGCAFILPVAMIYQRKRTLKGMIVGCIAGTVVLAIVGAFANYYLLLPVYSIVYGMPLEAFVEMGHVLNPAIVDIFTLVLWAVVPFNLLKGVVVSVLTVPLYKKLGSALERNR